MYYFAWIASGTVPFGPEHIRSDEDVFTAKIEQAEGEFATLTVEIRNPRVGLLAGTRPQWVWFSKSDGLGGAIPLFKGRVSSIPADLDREVITVEFTAKPSTYSALKTALAETLKVAPYYDPVWISADNETDPDTVLEGRSALWHIDRVTHEVTISDITSGEDGTLVFDPSSIFEDSISVSFDSLPVDTIKMTAKVSWDQAAKRTIDISRKIGEGFGGLVASYTGQGLQKSWPIYNDNIGGDWTFGACTLRLLSGTSLGSRFAECSIQPAPPTMTEPVIARFYLWEFGQQTSVKCDTSRSRTETITFTATADVQSFKGDETPDPLELSYDSQRITDLLDNGGTTMPIGSAARRTYFGTDRGTRSIDFLMCVVRANFLKSARAVEIDFQVPFDDAIAITLRKDAIIEHPLIPGGTARGKVISYSLEVDGDKGEEVATIRIGCTIGKGLVLATPDPGVPTYSDGSYDVDYEAYVGGNYQPLSGQIQYDPPVITLNKGGTVIDDGVDLETMDQDQIVTSFSVANPYNEQFDVIARGSDTIDNAIAALNAVKTVCTLILLPLNTGPFDNAFPITTAPFMIPKGLDLGA